LTNIVSGGRAMSLGMGSPDNMVFPENVIKIFLHPFRRAARVQKYFSQCLSYFKKETLTHSAHAV
ncbi:hypothetical protein MM716_29820, partial [Klebsiella pneumoniae]|nr:hypothetical protein [Klebsiella pneumoniae]